MISDDYKFIFLNIPKNAGQSIKSALFHITANKSYGAPNHADLTFFHKNFPEQTEFYLKFCVVRNPFDRIVSFYHYKKKLCKNYNPLNFHDNYHFLKNPKEVKIFSEQSFEYLLLNGYLNIGPQYPKMCIGKKFSINFLIRFENLQDDFNEFLSTRSMPSFKLPHKNKSQRQSYQTYYSNNSIEYVNKQYNIDLKAFGYNF